MTENFVSLDDLDAKKACEKPFEFPFLNAAGNPTGVMLKVLGSQSETVTKEVAILINERRRKEAAREMNRSMVIGAQTVEYETLENDVAFGQRLAAVRLVGWSGIREEWSPTNAFKLCSSNRDLSAQVTRQSDTIANFMKG